MRDLSRVRLKSSISNQRLVSLEKAKLGLLEFYSEPKFSSKKFSSDKPIPWTISYLLSHTREQSALCCSEVISDQAHLFEYWSRAALQNKPIMCGSDLSGFAPKALKFFRLSHINQSPSNGLSALSHLCAGISTPLFYLGTGGSVFGIRSEECDLCAIYQLLGGASKFWVIIPPNYYDQTLRMLSEVLSESYEVTRHNNLFISTRYLESHKIPHTIFEQKPGETLVFLPRALHFAWDAGDNLSQSTTFWPDTFKSFRESQDTVRRCQCGCQNLALSATRDELVHTAFENNVWVEKN